jgi:hypothetical protein
MVAGHWILGQAQPPILSPFAYMLGMYLLHSPACTSCNASSHPSLQLLNLFIAARNGLNKFLADSALMIQNITGGVKGTLIPFKHTFKKVGHAISRPVKKFVSVSVSHPATSFSA